MQNPLEKFAEFTNIKTLTEASAKPLRKSIRVNTLKSTAQEVQKWGAELGWTLSPVPWCAEGLFVDRTDESALGKDLLHQIGHIYLQEAASMLPVALLDPKPNETILDLCAAPGSKTTQIAAKMQNTGVIIANDVQEKRIWTLRGALQRSGVINTILTDKKGEWFGKQMTECFDRVLCDAPCSALGVLRKDPDAAKFLTPKHIEKLKQTQLRLLEAAIHATKIGGRIVYSTCTLTPEENEGVVMETLMKFSGKLEILDERLAMSDERLAKFDIATQDSFVVQKYLHNQNPSFQLIANRLPLVRLWPQTYDTEGFFCAVLEKKGRTRDVLPMEDFREERKELRPSRQEQITNELTKRYGTAFMRKEEVLHELGEHMVLTNTAVARFTFPAERYAFGLPFVKVQKDGRNRLTQELITFRGNEATLFFIDLTEKQVEDILAGKDTACDPALYGEMILRFKNLPIGLGMVKERTIKNWLPRRVLQQIA